MSIKEEVEVLRNIPLFSKIEPAKHTTEHILRSMLEPSKEIAEKYQSHTIVLTSGKVINGLIVEQRRVPQGIKTAQRDQRREDRGQV
mgnify:CR=1 FL=1